MLQISYPLDEKRITSGRQESRDPSETLPNVSESKADSSHDQLPYNAYDSWYAPERSLPII